MAEAVAARIPAREPSLSMMTSYGLGNKTTGGFLLAVILGLAALADHFGVSDGILGWVVAALVGIGVAVGVVKNLTGLSATRRTIGMNHRTIRLTKRMRQAMALANAGEPPEPAYVACRAAISGANPDIAALAVINLFSLMAPEAIADEVEDQKEPLSSALYLFWAQQARGEKHAEEEQGFYEQAFDAGEQFWATAAAVELMPLLDAKGEHDRALEVAGWIQTKGDGALALELMMLQD